MSGSDIGLTDGETATHDRRVATCFLSMCHQCAMLGFVDDTARDDKAHIGRSTPGFAITTSMMTRDLVMSLPPRGFAAWGG